MLDRNRLCEKIREIYPDIGECGIDIRAEYDEAQGRWTVHLKRGGRELKTFLEPGDAELCMEDKQCMALGIEIEQLKDSLQRMPKDR